MNRSVLLKYIRYSAWFGDRNCGRPNDQATHFKYKLTDPCISSLSRTTTHISRRTQTRPHEMLTQISAYNPPPSLHVLCKPKPSTFQTLCLCSLHYIASNFDKQRHQYFLVWMVQVDYISPSASLLLISATSK